MVAKYLIPVLFLTTILFWVLALFIPTQATLFSLLRNLSFGILLFYGGILLGMFLLLVTQYRNIEYAPLQKEQFKLTLADGVILHGEIFTTEAMNDSTPVVLACHGWDGTKEMLDLVTYPLVVQGYKIVCYNHRGHGKKPFKSTGNKGEIQKTFMDVQQVVDFIESRPDLNHEKLAAVGFSLGGYTLLTGGYLDPRIQLIMAFCTGHDWLETNRFWAWYVRLFYRSTGLPIYPSDELNQKISPKYFLEKKLENKIVCLSNTKNDMITPFEGFLKNKELLELPEEQTLTFETGDHGFFGQATVLLSQIIKWLKMYL